MDRRVQVFDTRLNSALQEGQAQEKLFNGGTLVLGVISAKNVPSTQGMFSSLSPFVKILCGKKILGQSPTLSSTINPQWNFDLPSFEVLPTDSPLITFEIYDDNKFSKDVLVSTAVLSLSDLIITTGGQAQEQTLDIFTNPNPSGSSSINIKVKFTINRIFDTGPGADVLLGNAQSYFIGVNYANPLQPRNSFPRKPKIFDLSFLYFDRNGNLMGSVSNNRFNKPIIFHYTKAYINRLKTTPTSNEEFSLGERMTYLTSNIFINANVNNTKRCLAATCDDIVRVDFGAMPAEAVAGFVVVSSEADGYYLNECEVMELVLADAQTAISKIRFQVPVVGRLTGPDGRTPISSIIMARFSRAPNSLEWKFQGIGSPLPSAYTYGMTIPELKNRMSDIYPSVAGRPTDSLAILKMGGTVNLNKMETRPSAAPGEFSIGVKWGFRNNKSSKDLEFGVLIFDENFQSIDCVHLGNKSARDGSVRVVPSTNPKDQQAVQISLPRMTRGSYALLLLSTPYNNTIDEVLDTLAVRLYETSPPNRNLAFYTLLDTKRVPPAFPDATLTGGRCSLIALMYRTVTAPQQPPPAAYSNNHVMSAVPSGGGAYSEWHFTALGDVSDGKMITSNQAAASSMLAKRQFSQTQQKIDQFVRAAMLTVTAMPVAIPQAVHVQVQGVQQQQQQQQMYTQQSNGVIRGVQIVSAVPVMSAIPSMSAIPLPQQYSTQPPQQQHSTQPSQQYSTQQQYQNKVMNPSVQVQQPQQYSTQSPQQQYSTQPPQQQQYSTQQGYGAAVVGGAVAGGVITAVIAAEATRNETYLTAMYTSAEAYGQAQQMQVPRQISGVPSQMSSQMHMPSQPNISMPTPSVNMSGVHRTYTEAGQMVGGAAASVGRNVPGNINIDTVGIMAGVNSLDIGGNINTASSAVYGVVAAAAGGAAYLGKQVLDVVGSTDSLAFLTVLSDVAVAVPLAGAIAVVLKSIFDAARLAKYNAVAADALSRRSKEVGATLADLLKTVRKTFASLDMQLERLHEILKEANGFLDKYASRNYLSRLLRGMSDSDDVKRIDKNLGDVVGNIQMSLGVQQIALQQRTLDELDEMKKVVESIHTGNGNGRSKSQGLDGSDDDKEALMNISPESYDKLSSMFKVPVNEFKDEVNMMCASIMASQSRIEAQLEKIAKMAGEGFGRTKKQSKRRVAQSVDDEVESFWTDYFGADKSIAFNRFVPAFEEEFNEGEDLGDSLMTVLQMILDNHPHDGFVSFAEWKRFFRLVSKEGISPIDYISNRE